MGEFDDHVAIIGDWMPPSPSPRALFSTLLCDDVSLRTVAEPTSENKAGFSFPGPVEHSASASSDQKDGSQGGAAVDQTSKFSSMSEQRMSSRRGLMERMAARAGFNAPRLNTESIRPTKNKRILILKVSFSNPNLLGCYRLHPNPTHLG